MKQGRSFTAVVMVLLTLCMAFGQPAQQVLAAESIDQQKATAWQQQLQALTEKMVAAQQQQQDRTQVHPVGQSSSGKCGKFFADPSLNTVYVAPNKNRIWFIGIDASKPVDVACNGTYSVVRTLDQTYKGQFVHTVAHINVPRNGRMEVWAIFVGTGDWDWGPMPAPVQVPAPIAAPQPPAQQPAASTGVTTTSGTPDKTCTSNYGGQTRTYRHGEGSASKCNGYTGQWMSPAEFANIATPNSAPTTTAPAAPSSTATNPPASAAQGPKIVPVPTPNGPAKNTYIVKLSNGQIGRYEVYQDQVPQADYTWVLVTGSTLALSDSPAPGPGDVVALFYLGGVLFAVAFKAIFITPYDRANTIKAIPYVYTNYIPAADKVYRPVELEISRVDAPPTFNPNDLPPEWPCWRMFEIAQSLAEFLSGGKPGNSFFIKGSAGPRIFLYNRPINRGGGTEPFRVDTLINGLKSCGNFGISVILTAGGNWLIEKIGQTGR